MISTDTAKPSYEAMMNLPRHNKTGRRRLLYATILIVVIFVADVISGGKIRTSLRTTAMPLWQASAYIFGGIAHIEPFASHARLAVENASLRAELVRYEGQDATDALLRQENAQLTDMVHLTQERLGTTTRVLSTFTTSSYGTFIISAGSAEGITQENIVLSNDGFVIGHIAEVGTHTSLVSHIFAPNNAVHATLDGSAVMVQGRGGGNAVLQISREARVKEGDVVTAPEYGGKPIGVVGKVVSDPSSAYSIILVRTPVNIESVTFVYVTKK